MAVKASVYRIGVPIPDASKATLGGKAFGLQKMVLAGIPVPPAYVIDVEACRSYMVDPEGVMAWVRESALPIIKSGLTAEFGYMPLVSVRSGAPVSMPGMMDTILNVGIDPNNYPAWENKLGADCATDCFARLQHMYSNVVGADYLPTVADEQIVGAIEAVFKSWNNERAKVVYRDLNGIPESMGTAVVIQAMVFGNLNEKSGTGVAFSRDYSSGENKATGNWLPTEMKDGKMVYGAGRGFRRWLKGGYSAAPRCRIGTRLSALSCSKRSTSLKQSSGTWSIRSSRFRTASFTCCKSGRGQCTAQAALKIAVDLFNEKVITADEALGRISLKQFLAASRPMIPGCVDQGEQGARYWCARQYG